jgi:putative ubiquitin-RnfH superfamily antitoxin RatB of RatAB toxin-antitoxin module
MIVEIIYLASKEQVFHQRLKIDSASTAEQALKNSKLFLEYPELFIEELNIGLFSKKITLEYQLQDGDRIEIYRPLTISPMEKRRLLASKK